VSSVFSDAVVTSICIASNYRYLVDYQFKRKLKGSILAIFEVQSQYSPGITELNN
jgi:hypothetical protein